MCGKYTSFTRESMHEGEKSSQIPDSITKQMIDRYIPLYRIREQSSTSPQQNTLLKKKKKICGQSGSRTHASGDNANHNRPSQAASFHLSASPQTTRPSNLAENHPKHTEIDIVVVVSLCLISLSDSVSLKSKSFAIRNDALHVYDDDLNGMSTSFEMPQLLKFDRISLGLVRSNA